MLAAVKAPDFDHIIVMSYTHLPIQEADSQTLICLLHLRNIAEAAGKDLNIVSEMMDLRNRELAQVARADDFIVKPFQLEELKARVRRRIRGRR